MVHSVTAKSAQQVVIDHAQNAGSLAGTVGNFLNVVPLAADSWFLRIQQKNAAGTFVDRLAALGPLIERDGLQVQFVAPTDASDILIRVEQVVSRSSDDVFTVVGKVIWSTGEPFAGTVKVFDLDLRHEQLLGTVTTAVDGTYELQYTPGGFSLFESGTADLLVRAVEGIEGGNQVVLGESSVRFNAGIRERVDLVLTSVPLTTLSEYDVLDLRIAPLLDGALPAELNDTRDVPFLSAEIGTSPDRVWLYALAHRFAATLGDVPPMALYGLLRQGVGTTLSTLLENTPERELQALTAAGQQFIIAVDRLGMTSDEVVARLQAHRQTVGAGKVRTLIADTPAHVITDAELTQVVALEATHTGSPEEFWQQVRALPGFSSPAKVADLQFAIQAFALTDGNLALAKLIQSKRPAGANDARALLDLSRADWQSLVQTSLGADGHLPPGVAGQTEADKIANYARGLQLAVEGAFTTVVLGKAIANPTPLDVAAARKVLLKNPNLDPKQPLRPDADLSDFVGEDARQHAIETMALLRGEALAYPGVDLRQAILNLPPTATLVPPTTFNPVRANLSQVFNQAPELDLTSRRAIDFIASEGAPLFAAIPDPAARAATADALRAHQRLSNVVSKPDIVNTLIANGFGSATQIARVAESTFVEQYGKLLLGSNVAQNIHRAARRQAAGAAALFALINRAVNEPTPAALGGRADPAELLGNDASWPSQFRQVELADCPHCRSVFGPAAYFVDLLHFLDTAIAPEGTTAPALALEQRRSDLYDLELTCQNTHEEVSFVDLVNQILEPFALNHTQPAPADILALLKQAVFPFSLPLDLPLEGERLLLDRLGTTRAELVQLFRAPSPQNAASAAAERLGISPALTNILTETPAAALSTYFGYPADSTAGWLNDATISGAQPRGLKFARTFLSRTELRFVELLELLTTSSVAHASSPGLGLLRNGDPADIDQMQISGLTDDSLLRLHRFLRLWRALRRRSPDLSLSELDALVSTFPVLAPGTGEEQKQQLASLAQADELRQDLKLPFLQAVTLWGLLDTRRPEVLDENGVTVQNPSLYESIFFNPVVVQDPDFEQSRVVGTTGLADLSDKVEALQAALRVSATEVTALLGELAALPGNDGKVSLANLSILYRYPLLARALKMSVSELVALKGLSQISLFSSPQTTRQFVDLVSLARGAKFRVAELVYLFQHRTDLDPTLPPEPALITSLARSLSDRLNKVAADTDPETPDPTGERLQGLLEALLGVGSPALLRAQNIIDGVSTPTSPAERQEFGAFLLANLPFLPNSQQTPPPASGVPTVDTVLFPPLTGTSQQQAEQRKQRRHFAFSNFQIFLGDQRRRDAVLETVGGALGLAGPIARLLLEQVLQSSTPGRTLLQDFLTPGAPDSPERAALTAGFTRLQKAALLINRFKLSESEVRYFQSHSASFGQFDLNRLPVTEVATPPLPFSAFGALARYFTVKSALPLPPAGGKQLIDVFAAAEGNQPIADVRALLAQVTEWNPADLEAITIVRSLTADSAFINADALGDVRDAMLVAERTGVSAATLVEWAGADADEAQANLVRSTLKAKFDEANWPNIAAPIDDALRDLEREALVGYILNLKAIRDLCITNPDELFEYFLIDVQMTSAMKTTPLVQATAAVQLFVQRCLLNLEKPRREGSSAPTVSPQAIDADRWKWMKNYRVWEANRKVFLYPENYIEPELRDNKTPFFRQLETDLMQGDITPATVESAYLSYLRKLDDVSRLEIVGHCHDFDTDVQHVFGRTRDMPAQYYYRRFEEGSWTGWDRVPLDIEGDHVAPAVYNRRLFLFWAIFTEKTSNPSEESLNTPAVGPTSDGTSKQPPRRWEVSLAWSEFRDGKWSPKRISTGEKGTMLNTNKASGTLSLVYGTTPWDSATTPAPLAGTGSDLANLFDQFLVPVDGDPSRFSPQTERYRLNIAPYFYVGTQLFVNLELEARDDSSGRAAHFLHLGYWNLARTGAALLSNAVLNRRWVDNKPSGWFGDSMAWRLPGDLKLLAPVGLLTEATRNVPGTEEAQVLARAVNASVVFSPQDWVPMFAPPFPAFFFQDAERQYYCTRQETTVRRWQTEQYLYPRGLENLKYVNETRLSTLRLNQADFGFATAFPYYSGSGLMADLPRLAFGGYFRELQLARVQFAVHYHPHSSTLIENLNAYGVDGIFGRVDQGLDDKGGVFTNLYQPTDLTFARLPRENFDFEIDGAHAPYNWELFFHIPLLLATRLSHQQRFEEARRWFHFVFDPTTNAAPPPDAKLAHLRFWRFLPFRQTEPARIQDLLRALADPAGDATLKASAAEQIRQWALHPFQPHRIARLRLGAYQKTVFFKYLDNLIAWGDQLFAQDTRESINEATQLYVLAEELLGPAPERIPEQATPAPLSYRQLRSRIDAFGNALIDVEDQLATTALGQADIASLASTEADGATVVGLGETLFFCIPQNQKLLSYWNTIADRLFKIRHGLNLQGVARPLPLFAPELEPGALVRAAAAGLDVGTVVSDLTAPLGFYRFNYVLPKALEFCNEVKQFGASLLSTLEKKDAEALSNLRAQQESGLLELVRRVREQQIKEAEITLAGLEKTRAMVEFRRDYYASLEPINARESEHLAALDAAAVLQDLAQISEILATVLHAIPNFKLGVAGFGGSPEVGATLGGDNLGSVASAAGRALGFAALLETNKANRAALLGGWDRRAQDWKFQADVASKELLQIDQQIAAASVRIQMANLELENHDRQIANAKDVEDFLRTKFTNEDLYGFLIAEVSGLYFQTYQLAYQMAKQAERLYRFERGLQSSSFVSFGAWDSLKRGLLAGERLSLDLRRLEVAYIQQNAREYELTKSISLVLHDPAALITLKTTGRCEFHLPEELYDLDHPGHFMRRIKALSITVPCVTGPYTGVHARLTLVSSRIRADGDASGSYPEAQPDARFLVDFSAVQTIATSTGQNDTGLFELSFRDERYLPFEGAGAISEWRLELPAATNAFDLDSITDIVLRVQFTAREGGDLLRQKALAAAIQPPSLRNISADPNTPLDEPEQSTLSRLFSVRHEFPDAWNAFLHPASAEAGQTLRLDIESERFPQQLRGRKLTIQSFALLLEWDEVVPKTAARAVPLQLTPPGSPTPPAVTIKTVSNPNVLFGLPYGSSDATQPFTAGPGLWTFTVNESDISKLDPALQVVIAGHTRIVTERLRDIVLIAQYGVSKGS